MKRKISNSELEVLDLLNEINGVSRTSTLEEISSNSKRILEKVKNDSETKITKPVRSTNVKAVDETTKEITKPIPDADVIAVDETTTEITDPISDADVIAVDETITEIVELVPDTNVVAVDETATEIAESELDTDVVIEDTELTFENKFNVLESKRRVKCTAGKHNDNFVKSFATLRIKDNKSTKWINMCETCLVDFLKLAQRCYADDNFTVITSQDNDLIKMSISVVTDNSKCPFCPDGHEQLYRIKVKKKSFVICRSCLFKLINKIISFLHYHSNDEVIESIAQFFNENGIPYKNIYRLKAYRKYFKIYERYNTLEEKTELEVNNKQTVFDEVNNQLTIPDDINLEKAKELLLEYQKIISIKDNYINDLTAMIEKRDKTITNQNIDKELIIKKSDGRKTHIEQLKIRIKRQNDEKEKLLISNADLEDKLHKKDTTISDLRQRLFSLDYSLQAAYETIDKLSQGQKKITKNELPLLDNSKSKKSKTSILEKIQAVKEIIRLIK